MPLGVKTLALLASFGGVENREVVEARGRSCAMLFHPSDGGTLLKTLVVVFCFFFSLIYLFTRFSGCRREGVG